MATERIIFVGGCPRSGTTLVQNMLDSHPHVLGGPEFLHLVDILKLRSKLLTSVDKGWIDLFCSRAEVDEHIKTLINALLLPLADQHGAHFLSEKSPDNVKVLSEIAELYPNAKVIHIVRDPRAVMASLLAAGKRAKTKGEVPAPFTRDAYSAIRYITRCLKGGFKASKQHPDQVYTLVYEDLVKDPEQESKKLCQFLEMPWDQTMLNPAEKKHLGEAAITVNSGEIWYDKQTYYSNPNAERLAAWRTELKPFQQVLANRAFCKLADLNRFGYDWSLPVTDNKVVEIVAKLQAYWLLIAAKVKNKIASALADHQVT